MVTQVRALDRKALALATPIPGLAERLGEWDVRQATEQQLRGRSHALRLVVLRTVRFHRRRDAIAYGRAVAHGAAAFLGSGTRVSSEGTGPERWVIRAAICGCHPQPPTLIRLSVAGADVSWLSISGDGATARRLRSVARALGDPDRARAD